VRIPTQVEIEAERERRYEQRVMNNRLFEVYIEKIKQRKSYIFFADLGELIAKVYR
jgi:hypothetical protein